MSGERARRQRVSESQREIRILFENVHSNTSSWWRKQEGHAHSQRRGMRGARTSISGMRKCVPSPITFGLIPLKRSQITARWPPSTARVMAHVREWAANDRRGLQQARARNRNTQASPRTIIQAIIDCIASKAEPKTGKRDAVENSSDSRHSFGSPKSYERVPVNFLWSWLPQLSLDAFEAC